MSETKLELPHRKPDDEDDLVLDIHSQMDELYGLLQHEIDDRNPDQERESSDTVTEALMEDEISLDTEKLEDDTVYPSDIGSRDISMAESSMEVSEDVVSTHETLFPAEPDPDILILKDSGDDSDLQKPMVVRKRVVKGVVPEGCSLLQAIEELMEKGDLKKAEFIIRKSIEINRKNPRMNILLGKILFDTGRVMESQRYFDRALSLNNLDPEPWLYLGIISLRSDPPNKMEAIIFLQHAKKIDPYNERIDEYLSQCH